MSSQPSASPGRVAAISYTGGLEELLVGFNSNEFFERHFEVAPFSGYCNVDFSVTDTDLFNLLPQACVDKNVRFLDITEDFTGLSDAGLRALLQPGTSLEQPSTFEILFSDRGISYAIQEIERYLPAAARVKELLATQFDGHVTATGFFTPPRSRSTRAHFDLNEFFAIQVFGEKTWSVSEPIQELPNNRVFPIPVPEADLLKCHSQYSLKRGDALYLPRGWIHDVQNVATISSFHISFVLFVDSWMSLFGNIMDAVYSRMRSERRWREMVTRGALQRPEIQLGLQAMANQFASHFSLLAKDSLDPYLDNIQNNNRNTEIASRARESATRCDATDFIVLPSGVHYLLRHSDDGQYVEVTADGRSYYRISNEHWECLTRHGRRGTPANEFELMEGVVELLELVVARLGIFRIEASPARALGLRR